VTEAPPAQPQRVNPPDPSPRAGEARRRAAGSGVRTFTNNPLGVAPIRVVSLGLFAGAAALACAAVARSPAEFLASPADALPGLAFAALVAGAGLLVRHRAYIDLWQFDTGRRVATRVRRRLLYETAEESFPFDAVAAVELTETQSDDFSYSVDLVLGSGRTVFVSNDRGHAADLALLLGVPTRRG
jgi:hypothetical protein